jgi:fatty-acyl-CoA synthase
VTTVAGLVRQAAQEWPGELALVAETPAGERTWTFAELLADAERVARALLAVIEPGERVAMWAPNTHEWFLLQLGAALAGTTLVTVNPAYRPAELADVLGRSRCTALVFASQVRGTDMCSILDEVRPMLPYLRTAIQLDDWETFLKRAPAARTELPTVYDTDAAQIQFTSGTTGAPKAALLPQAAMCANAAAGAARWNVRPGERWLNAMPMFHVAGSIINALGALAAGATQLLTPFDPERIAAIWQRHHPDIGCLAGTMWAMLLDHPAVASAELSGLRLAVTGGQCIPPELVDRVEARTGGTMSILYGMTELCGTGTAAAPDANTETRRETCGHALPGVEVRIADPNTGATLDSNVIGEIQVRGWLTMSGYLDDPAATAEVIMPDGWLRTGDLGTLDADRMLRVTGRVKEMIIRGAENIYPAEIENRLRCHPAVADAAVVGLPDPLYGETVACALVLRGGASMPSAEDLTQFCRTALAPFKTPKRWIELPALPLTPSGKVRKFMVRDALLAASPTT